MKKKVLTILLLLIVVCFSMSSCGVENNESDAMQTYDFIVPTEQYNGQIIEEANYMLSIISDISELSYEGKKLKIEFCITNFGSKIEVGFQILTGGLVVPSTINGEENFNHIFNVEEKGQYTFFAEFDVLSDGNDSYFQPMCVLSPSMRLSEDNKHFGNAFRIVATSPIKVISNTNNMSSFSFENEYKNIDITEDNAEFLNVPFECGRQIFMSQNEYLDIIITDSKTAASYYLSLFVNNKPVTINKGKNGVKVFAKPGEYTVLNIELDNKYENGDVITAILAPDGDSFELPSTFFITSNPVSYLNNEEFSSIEQENEEISEKDNSSIVENPIDISEKSFAGEILGIDINDNAYVFNYSSVTLLDSYCNEIKSHSFSKQDPSQLFFSGITYDFFLVDKGVYTIKTNNGYSEDSNSVGKTIYLLDSDLNIQNEFYLGNCICAVSNGFGKIVTANLDHTAVKLTLYENVNGKLSVNKTITLPSDIAIIQTMCFSEDENIVAFIGNYSNDDDKSILGTVNLTDEKVYTAICDTEYESIRGCNNNEFMIKPKYRNNAIIIMNEDGAKQYYLPDNGFEIMNCGYSFDGEYIWIIDSSYNGIITVYSSVTKEYIYSVELKNTKLLNAAFGKNVMFYTDTEGNTYAMRR